MLKIIITISNLILKDRELVNTLLIYKLETTILNWMMWAKITSVLIC